MIHIMDTCKEIGALAQVHAENGDMIDEVTKCLTGLSLIFMVVVLIEVIPKLINLQNLKTSIWIEQEMNWLARLKNSELI